MEIRDLEIGRYKFRIYTPLEQKPMSLQIKTPLMLAFFLLPLNASAQNKGYEKVKDLFVDSNELYYLMVQKEFPLNDSIVFGYTGFNDSLSVYIDDRLVYSGVPHYDAAIGYGDEIFRMKRKKGNKPYSMYVEFHGRQTWAKTILLNNYNSVLIHNRQNYSEDMSEYKESVFIFFYKEDDRFIDY